MKKLVLAEKPSVAKDYAKSLGCRNRQDGYFEGPNYVITWAFGHLFTLKDPADYNESYKQWRLDCLPIVPEPFAIKLIDSPHVKQQFKIIRDQLHREDVGSIVIGTDAGREGELIARYILLAAKNNKPVYRLWLSSLTEKDIQQGFQSLKPAREYDPIFQAAQARNELDWILGLNFTRAFTVKHGRKTLLSIGRCQTPVLAMICQRDREIEQFKPETYWELAAKFEKGKEFYQGKYLADSGDSFRIADQGTADGILAEVQGKMGEIIDVQKDIKKKPHPLLFNLTNLQRTLNRKYGYTAQEVLDIMQDLYEKHKVLSYPRTAARHISEAMVPELPKIIGALSFGKFKRFAEAILGSGELLVTKRIADDTMLTDHTAIIPVTNSKVVGIYESLNEQERNAFDEVAFSFLAAFFPDYVYESASVLTKVSDYSFLTRGIRVVDDGWRQVYQEPAEEEEDDSSEGQIPELELGQKVAVKDAFLETKKTKPPSRFTENSVLALMENPSGLIEEDSLRKAIRGHGIGTDATRATIIEVLIKRGFIERKKKQLISTPLGRQLVDAVNIDLLKSPELTAEWEQNLEKIAAGEMEKEDFMSDTIGFIQQGIQKVKQMEITPIVLPDKNAMGNCPYCDVGQVIRNKAGWGCNQWKTNNCKFFVSREMMGKKITETQVKSLVTKGKSNLIKGFKSKGGKNFDAYLVVDKGGKMIKLEFKKKG